MGNLDHFGDQLLFFAGIILAPSSLEDSRKDRRRIDLVRECMGDKNQIKTHVSMGNTL